MRWPFLLIGLLFKPPLTTASPFSWYTGGETHSLQVRQAPDCNDLGATFFQACYGILNIGAYLDNPVTGWNHTTPTCNDLEDGANCCLVGEPWTTCYLRLAHGQAGYDCSEINPQSCSYNPQMAVNPIIAPEVRYTMKNIYAVNEFFTTYWQALGYALTEAQLVIESIINELDPQATTTFNVLDILTVLSVGLAFLGAPSLAVVLLSFATTTRFAAQAFIISLQQAPSVGKTLWPQGSDASHFLQIGALSQALSNASSALQGQLNAGLELLMSDVPSFVNFTQSGAYSGMTSLALPTKTEGLDFAFSTYLLSLAMGKNGWQAYKSQNLTKEEMTTSAAEGCTWDANNLCGQGFFASPVTGNVYNLLVEKWPNNNDPNQVMKDIISNNWADLSILFDGAYNCTMAGLSGTGNPVNFDGGGNPDLACISQLPFCMRCFEPCPTYLVNGQCPFSICGYGSCS